MKFYRYLFVSETMDTKKEKILQKLQNHEYPIGIYLLVLPDKGPDQLEFFSSAMLRQRCIKEDDLFVVGLARGYDDAVELVEQIVKQVYKETGGTDIPSYIEKKEAQES